MRARPILLAVTAMLMLGACGDDSNEGASSSTRPSGEGPASATGPGVTDEEVRVSVVSPLTNPLGTDYRAYANGIQAYFNMVNENGGVHGKQLTIAKSRDDQLVNNTAEITAALAEDNPFAIMTAPLVFDAGPKLEKQGIPTFVWGIDASFSGPENIFTEAGFIGRYPNPIYPFVIQAEGKKRVGLLSYNDPASGNCAEDFRAAMRTWPTAQVAFADTSLSFGDLGALPTDVSKMKDAGVDIVFTCLDQNSVLTLAQEMHKQGLAAEQILLNAYDPAFISKNAAVLEGSVVHVVYAPLETSPQPKGVADYRAAMDDAGFEKTELAMVGWLNAAMLVHGIEEAGPGFTRQSVIDALNATTSFDADGLVAPVDWTVEHSAPNENECAAWLRVESGKFEPMLDQPGKPFMCIPVAPDSLPTEPSSYVG